MATSFFPEGLSPLTRSNAAQRGTHIRRRNRKRSDGAVAVVRPAAAVIPGVGDFFIVRQSLW